jgi:hypothetical protein
MLRSFVRKAVGFNPATFVIARPSFVLDQVRAHSLPCMLCSAAQHPQCSVVQCSVWRAAELVCKNVQYYTVRHEPVQCISEVRYRPTFAREDALLHIHAHTSTHSLAPTQLAVFILLLGSIESVVLMSVDTAHAHSRCPYSQPKSRSHHSNSSPNSLPRCLQLVVFISILKRVESFVLVDVDDLVQTARGGGK